MSQDTRQQQILDLVHQRGFMSIEALADHFSVTPQTVRRCGWAMLPQHDLSQKNLGRA